jgi:hypothetical protein
MRLIRFLLALLRRLLGRDARLNSPDNLEVLFMAGNLTVRWRNAATFDDGNPAEIARTVIEARTGSLPFTPVAQMTDPATLVPGEMAERLFPSHPGGTWDYRVTHVDPDGTPGRSAEGQVVVPRGQLNAPTELSLAVTP